MRRNLSRYRRSLGLRFAAEVAESVSPEEKEQVLMRFGAWDKSHPITPEWLWSEKFDGVRSLFLPASGTLESRNGRNLAAPEEFVSYLQDFNRHLARTLFEYHYRMPYAEQELDRLSVAPFHIALDGELWGGRDRFQELISAVKTPATLNPPQERWKFQLGLRHAHAEELLQQSEIVRAQEEGRSAVELLAPQRPSQRSPGGGHWGVYFMVFDWLCQSAPPCLLEHLRGMPFGERYEMLQRAHATFVAEAGASPVRVVEHGSCSNIDDPEGPSALIAVLLPHHSTSWGLPEGVMLRGQGGSYENGRRSLQVLKVKSDLEYECLCVGVTEGQGRLQGLVGALECEIVGRDGRLLHFSCGSGLSDEDRWPLNKARTEFDPRKPEGKSGYIGRVLTLRCNGHTDSGRPRFPRFVRWRGDRDRSEMRLFGSGMQVDVRPRTLTCRVSVAEARRLAEDASKCGQNGGMCGTCQGDLSLNIEVVSGELKGKSFSVDERSLPDGFLSYLAQSPEMQGGLMLKVQLFGQSPFGCPVVVTWGSEMEEQLATTVQDLDLPIVDEVQSSDVEIPTNGTKAKAAPNGTKVKGATGAVARQKVTGGTKLRAAAAATDSWIPLDRVTKGAKAASGRASGTKAARGTKLQRASVVNDQWIPLEGGAKAKSKVALDKTGGDWYVGGPKKAGLFRSKLKAAAKGIKSQTTTFGNFERVVQPKSKELGTNFPVEASPVSNETHKIATTTPKAVALPPEETPVVKMSTAVPFPDSITGVMSAFIVGYVQQTFGGRVNNDDNGTQRTHSPILLSESRY
eukprot:Hpha_TRINITY_DN15029_c5_g2::TRINITY_DN15029_c5_g2_i3::g.125576::m.125576